ncbi:MAG: T9SS type A sorting domain-containing protein [Aureispira sp.]|nr:T9SS type A sorting domain-containing protein [Aureispira sp.]
MKKIYQYIGIVLLLKLLGSSMLLGQVPFFVKSAQTDSLTKNVLVEAFTSANYPNVNVLEGNLYNDLKNHGSNINYIQYHMGAYGSDPLHDRSDALNNSRILYYGITNAGKTTINGVLQNGLYTVDSTVIAQSSSSKPSFHIELSQTLFTDNTISVSANIKALDIMPMDDYTVHLVLVEDNIPSSIATIRQAVALRSLPNPAGTQFNRSWNIGDLVNISETYDFNLLNQQSQALNSTNVRVVAFIANNSTHEVYQSLSSDVVDWNLEGKKWIEGNIYHDLDADCQKDSIELWSANIGIVKVENNLALTPPLYAQVDADGHYYAFVDSGDYRLSVLEPNSYWQACSGTLITTTNSTNILNLGIQSLVQSPLLTVDIATPFIRRCFSGTYTVKYCNDGTVDATNAYIEIELDPALQVTSTTIPWISQVGNLYRFDIDTVAVGECNSFYISYDVDCDSTVLGQTHCTEAHIYPDTLVLPLTEPNIILSVNCEGDSVLFDIQNTGQGDMNSALDYFVTEDEIILRTDNYQLLAGEGRSIRVPANGRTYYMQAEHPSGHPYHSIVVAGLEGCGNGTFVPGFLTQYPLGNELPSIDRDCQENIGAYDPNDKKGYPVGYGPEHYINKNQKLSYTIRCQNTGTDTAFTVKIVDHLAPSLDLSTLKMGAASHPYTWSVEGRLLEIVFDNILLVDSNTNEPGSHGFVQFEIDQVLNNSIGTEIENTAAIYFDFNEPVITNTTLHTIGERFIVVADEESEEKDTSKSSMDADNSAPVELLISPNPLADLATVTVKGGDYEQIQFVLYDMAGKKLRDIRSSQSTFELDATHLFKGMYLYRIIGDGEVIGSGKLIVND